MPLNHQVRKQKRALKNQQLERPKQWERRREQAFFDWTIEEGNWMTLPKDVKTPGAGYDAIICMGNSFPHLIDDHGDFR